ncbi:MAG TPA: sigma-70 family RNA polymerase sigma factor [Gemmatimonadaceae bacterium]|nr:sigma-70 family RNA polymerase sigma factor [Gemmatimonadaceae bacterium]
MRADDDDSDTNQPPDIPPAPDSLALDRLLGIPDTEIVTRIRDGDTELFRQLFRAYHKPLVRVANFYLHSVQTAEEVVADTLSHVWELRATWIIRHSVESYLFGAVRHRVQNLARGARREQHWQDVFDRDALPAMGEPPERPDTAVANADLRDRLWSAIATFPERTRLILVLRWQQEMTFDEIAEVLGVAAAAVRQTHSRALRHLRSTLPDFLR